jgi:hypothetical protein
VGHSPGFKAYTRCYLAVERLSKWISSNSEYNGRFSSSLLMGRLDAIYHEGIVVPGRSWPWLDDTKEEIQTGTSRSS